MQDNIRQIESRRALYASGVWPSNDHRRALLAMGPSQFPQEAVARIYKPSRSLMTSGKARMKGWRLTFARRTAPFVEPLMGWTGGDDTLPQVELDFPTLKSAIWYAERQGLPYSVQYTNSADDHERHLKRSTHAFSDATLQKLGLEDLQTSYGRAIDGAANRKDPAGPETWGSPMDVIRDRALSLDAKRSILINWAFTEFLIDQAIKEGLPENNRLARLDEVEQALIALERQVADDPRPSTARRA